MSASVLWFRRDLRLSDHPALLAARDAGSPVIPVFVLDDALRRAAGAARLAFLYRTLRDIEQATDGALRVLTGRPEVVLPSLVEQVDAPSVHVSADFAPYGRSRDERVRDALADRGVELVATGSPYAVSPGRLTKSDGSGYAVYTPFYRAWQAHGVRAPAPRPQAVDWSDGGVRSDAIPPDPSIGDKQLPPAGEAVALDRWAEFRDTALVSYATNRDRPDLHRTSQVSVYLKYGALHPRTLLADLAASEGAERYRGELAWRDFYADVLWRDPASARRSLRPEMERMQVDAGPAAEERFTAWTQGRTGFPFVDAGMRQLLACGWVHNRVRMVVASFLVKDLHVDWTRGARHFMTELVDGDLASNNHGWQWVAGTGTDPAPYFRIFNPVTQGRTHDPAGDYVRRFVPELRGIPGAGVHEPWTCPGGTPPGYPPPIVEHAAERKESLRRYAAARG